MKLRSQSHSREEASYHIVFCPKYRHGIFSYARLKRLCETIIHGVAARYGLEIRALEIMPDHVHAFVSIPPSISLSNVLHAIRGTTGFKFFRAFPWLKEYKPGDMRFWGGHFWSRGMIDLISGLVFSSQRGSKISIIFKKKDNRGNKKTGSIDSSSFKTEDLKKSFKVLKKYAVYYHIPLENKLKW